MCERFSPIIANEMHISALIFALFCNAKRNVVNSPSIKPDESLSNISEQDTKDKVMLCSNCGKKIE